MYEQCRLFSRSAEGPPILHGGRDQNDILERFFNKLLTPQGYRPFPLVARLIFTDFLSMPRAIASVAVTH
jgi:hypothetical protein